MARHIEQKHKAIYEELCLFIEKCTTSPNSVQNYTDFKRINECINEVLGKENVSILDFTDPVEFTNLIKLLNSNEKYKSYNRKGNNQYSSAVLNYQNFLFARQYAELLKSDSADNYLQTIINEKLEDAYSQESLVKILKAYRDLYKQDGVLTNYACDVAFGIKYGKYLENNTTKTIANDASNPDDSNSVRDGYFVNIGVSTYQAICQEKYGLSFKNHIKLNKFRIIIGNPLQQIFYGAPGTGKSHRIKEIIKEHGIDEKEQVIRTTFHPDSDYSTFVGCYKPIMKSVPQTYVVEGNEKPVMVNKDTQATKEEIVYNYTPQAFVQAYTKAWTTDKPVILVIEEINRGNCAQIFGDIFQLLDRGDDGVSEYEIKPDKALENYLKDYFAAFEDVDEQIKSGKIMKLPANLYIWATMNTSDQSLFPIDSAFKRRWEWKYIKIAWPYKKNEDGTFKMNENGEKIHFNYQIEGGHDWWEFLQQINAIIDKMTNSADKQLGYFFAKAKDDVISYDTFVSKVCFYLWNDIFKTYALDEQQGDLFSYTDNEGKKKQLTFPAFYDGDGNVIKEVAEAFIGNVMRWNTDTKNDKA